MHPQVRQPTAAAIQGRIPDFKVTLHYSTLVLWQMSKRWNVGSAPHRFQISELKMPNSNVWGDFFLSNITFSTSFSWKLYKSKKALWAFWWPFGKVWEEGKVLQIWLDPCFHFVIFTLLIQFVSLQMINLTKLYSVCMYFETPKYWNVCQNPAPQISLSDMIPWRT